MVNFVTMDEENPNDCMNIFKIVPEISERTSEVQTSGLDSLNFLSDNSGKNLLCDIFDDIGSLDNISRVSNPNNILLNLTEDKFNDALLSNGIPSNLPQTIDNLSHDYKFHELNNFSSIQHFCSMNEHTAQDSRLEFSCPTSLMNDELQNVERALSCRNDSTCSSSLQNLETGYLPKLRTGTYAAQEETTLTAFENGLNNEPNGLVYNFDYGANQNIYQGSAEVENTEASHLANAYPTDFHVFQNVNQTSRSGDGNNGFERPEPLAAQKVDEDEKINAIKAEVVSHPLFNQLLEAHVACLKVATPLDQIPLLDLQLEKKNLVIEKYEKFLKDPKYGNFKNKIEETTELNFFMTHFVCLLQSFKSQLEQHVLIQAREAVMSCWELEQSLISLTGMEPRPGTGLTMSDDDDDDLDDEDTIDYDKHASETLTDGNQDPYGPLTPSENERSIMERMRTELKKQLSDQGYRTKIADVREEIMRKRRAGKLPSDTTQILKSWWNAHSKWPYPTEDEKTTLVRETGLELKQINNWFINQRKRNWHNNSSQSRGSKRKLKDDNAGG